MAGEHEDNLLIREIQQLAADGEDMIRLGDLQRAHHYFTRAFKRIQSGRTREIKGHLYSLNRVGKLINSKEKTR